MTYFCSEFIMEFLLPLGLLYIYIHPHNSLSCLLRVISIQIWSLWLECSILVYTEPNPSLTYMAVPRIPVIPKFSSAGTLFFCCFGLIFCYHYNIWIVSLQEHQQGFFFIEELIGFRIVLS